MHKMHQTEPSYDEVMNVQLRQLRALVSVADEGTFTDAATVLGISQAAVSRTIAGLEAELGVRLLRRTTRQAAATAVGMRVIARARRILAEGDELERLVDGGPGGLGGGVALSAAGRA